MRVTVLFILVFVFVGCQDNTKDKIRLMGAQKSAYNYTQANENEKNRENKIKISNIDAKTKVEIAKIEAENKALIAKLQAATSKELAKTNATTKIQTAQINSNVKRDGIKSTTYIAIAFIVLLMIALFIFYFNSKKNRELKAKLSKEKIDKDMLLHERELNEKRFHKILDMVGKGKLSPEIEADVIKSLTNSADKGTKTIEHK